MKNIENETMSYIKGGAWDDDIDIACLGLTVLGTLRLEFTMLGAFCAGWGVGRAMFN